jgi:cytochrome b subunit of formate dehydrogenase
MWFGKGIVPPTLFPWMGIFHDLAMIVSVCMLLVHLFLAVAHPLMWAGLVSMRFGVTSADYAAEHHANWYYGSKRAMEMYEATKREALVGQAIRDLGKTGAPAPSRSKDHVEE